MAASSLHLTAPVTCKPIGASKLYPSRLAQALQPAASNTRCSYTKRPCNSETSATDNDNSTSVVDKFEKNFKWSNVYYEFRRRQQHENKQDAIKRRRREGAFKKRQIYFTSYSEQTQAGLNIPPFADLYDDGEDDLFGDDIFNGNGKT